MPSYKRRVRDLFLLAAELGEADAYEEVALSYYATTTNENPTKAVEYYLKGANAGSAICMRHLADIYKNGFGTIKPDREKHIYYLKLAAEKGNSIAQYWLGCAYYKGNYGLPKDKKMADFWFEKSANNEKEPYSYAKLPLNGDYSKIQ